MSFSDIVLLSLHQKSVQASISYSSTGSAEGHSEQFQASISIATSSMSLTSIDANKSLEILYQEAITAIDLELEASHGPNATEQAYQQGIDFSPEATAERIINFATSFLDAFRTQNEDLSEEDSLNEYMTIITDAFEKGFQEAVEILSALDVYSDQIQHNAEQTYSLVHEGFEEFKLLEQA